MQVCLNELFQEGWFGNVVSKEDVLPCGILSVCYDVLNEINLHAVLGEAKSYEVTLAKSHDRRGAPQFKKYA